MKKQSYRVVGNKTAADVVAGNDEILETGYSKEEAKLAAIVYQRDFGYVAAWIEEEAGKPAPSTPAGEATMIAIENHPNMARAIERAKSIRPRVRVVSADARTYSVTGSKGDLYTVRFAVAGGRKLAECDCKAGQAGQLCYHVASAAQVNVMTQSMRRRASPPAAPPAPAPSRRAAGWYGRRGGDAMRIGCWAV